MVTGGDADAAAAMVQLHSALHSRTPAMTLDITTRVKTQIVLKDVDYHDSDRRTYPHAR